MKTKETQQTFPLEREESLEKRKVKNQLVLPASIKQIERSMITYHNPNIRIGFHIPKEKTLHASFERMIDTPLRSYQIYISNGWAWQPPKVDVTDIRQTKAFLERNNKYACVHGCLLYNLAGSVQGKSDPDFHRRLDNNRFGLMGELDVATGFDSGVVVHIGSCRDTQEGIRTISKTVESVLRGQTRETEKLAKNLQIDLEQFKASRKVILENAAGEGSKIGSTLDEISQVIEGVGEEVRDQVKVCIDTAHIFGAGQYDFGSPRSVVQFYSDFEEKIGLDRLELFHLNDSRVPFGSKKDRHENIGLGYIFGVERDEDTYGDGVDGLTKFLELAEEHRIPLIGEPPSKMKDKTPGPGGMWDYKVIRGLCKLEEQVFVCD